MADRRSDDLDLDALAAGRADAQTLGRFASALSRSAREAGARAVATGQWLANVVIDLAPRIPVRDLQTLMGQHEGRSGGELADELVRRASRASAVVGASAGALMSAGELSPPAWITLPFELVVETVAVAAIELKLIAELHEAYGVPVTGAPGDRSMALLKAWAERRGVSVATLGKPGGVRDALGRGTRHEITRLVRRRMMARLGRNLSSLAPLLAGAVAGAEVNRRATRALGEAIQRDLGANT